MSNFESMGLVNAGLPGTAPQLFTASTVDDLATITAVGYLNDQSARIKKGDFFFINYLDTSAFPLNTGEACSTARFQVTYSAPNWSLVQTDVSGFLLASNNLSDVANAATSRANLGLGSASNVSFLNVTAGNSGNAGYLRSYPAGAASGYLELQAANSAGDYAAIIRNASLGQAVTWTLADPGNANSKIFQAAGSLVSGNFAVASGTGGLYVDSGYNVDNILLYASVAVTAAEFNGMYAAPKLLIAAPGANKMIVVDRAELVMTFVSAAYAAGGVVGLQYDSTVHGAGVAASNTEAAADFFAAASTVFQFNGVSGNTVAISPFTTSVNKGLYISNLTQAFTTGDSTWVMKIHYRIIATA